MKKISFLAIFFFLAVLCAHGQMGKKKPAITVTYEPGYVNIIEIGPGLGLLDVEADYSRYVFSLTSVNGYLINKTFLAGIGAGFNIYNGGIMVPLFVDLRYTLKNGVYEPFILMDQGLLLSVNDIVNNTALFINPGVGIRKVLSGRMAFYANMGLMVQMSPGIGRSSFLTVRAGLMLSRKYILRSPRMPVL